MGLLDSFKPALVTAIAEAKNTDVVLSVVDESLRRAAEAREQRERDEAERRIREERDARIQEFERREEQASLELREREEREAREAAEREAESVTLRSVLLDSYRTRGRLDVEL